MWRGSRGAGGAKRGVGGLVHKRRWPPPRHHALRASQRVGVPAHLVWGKSDLRRVMTRRLTPGQAPCRVGAAAGMHRAAITRGQGSRPCAQLAPTHSQASQKGPLWASMGRRSAHTAGCAVGPTHPSIMHPGIRNNQLLVLLTQQAYPHLDHHVVLLHHTVVGEATHGGDVLHRHVVLCRGGGGGCPGGEHYRAARGQHRMQHVQEGGVQPGGPGRARMQARCLPWAARAGGAVSVRILSRSRGSAGESNVSSSSGAERAEPSMGAATQCTSGRGGTARARSRSMRQSMQHRAGITSQSGRASRLEKPGKTKGEQG